MVAAAALAIPAAKKGAEALFQLAQTPVVGWTTTESFQRGKKAISRTTSFSLRVWEIALVGAVGLGALIFLTPSKGDFPAGLDRPWWLGQGSIADRIVRGIIPF